MTDKITEVLVDPKWKWGRIQLGNLPFITLVHPIHGEITSVLADETLNAFISGLITLQNMKDPARG